MVSVVCRMAIAIRETRKETEMLALDLFCGGGGACIGMQNAGFEVVGVDIKPHPNYPSHFIQADVHDLPVLIDDFDFVWASPPCQRFSVARDKFAKTNPIDLIPITREILKGPHFTCIENVPFAPIRPDVVLTGQSVGLSYIWRKRHFETSFFMMYPPVSTGLSDRRYWEQGKAITVTKSMCFKSHYNARVKLGLLGRPSLEEVKNVMGIPQSQEMTYSELGESIPPAYSEFIAREAMRQIQMDRR